jgi:predicted permease
MFWRRKRSVSDFTEEIQTHLQLEADDLKAEGLTDAQALLGARKAFGNVTAAQERFYERTRLVWLDDLGRDLRFGLRMMRRSPAFTAAAVLTLALGMGANTAIFSLMDAVLLRSLHVKDPASLYFLNNAGARGVGGSPPYPCFERFRSQAKSLAGIAAYAVGDFGIRVDGPIEQVDGARVSGGYYGVLGLTPFAGRLLTAEDERLDPPVAVISYGFWQRRFGGNPDAIGKTFALDGTLGGQRFTIVGITPRGFNGLAPGRNDEVMMPITIAGPKVLTAPHTWWFRSIARLKPGVSAEQARAEIDPIFQAFMNEFPESSEARRDHFDHMECTSASRGLDDLRKQFSRPLWALMALVGLVLLIACANITNLLLARAATRAREFAVRVAIGAGRARLLRQLLVETGLLFAAGAIAGLGLARWAAHGVIAFFATGSRPILLDAHWDWRVLGFTAGLSLLATVIFGAAPILRAMRANPHIAIKDGGRATSSRGRLESRQLLVVLQVALSLILLAGAALFLRTLKNLYKIDPGFRADQVALISIHLPDTSYHEAAARIGFWDRLLADVRSVAGVRSASLSTMTPLDGTTETWGFTAPGFQPRSDQDRSIGVNIVSEDYFTTLGIPLLQGRDLTKADQLGTVSVALLNDSAARHYFGGRDPIGAMGKLNDRPYRIIGVVQDARQLDLRQEAGRFIYIPMRRIGGARLALSIRTAADPRPLIAAIQGRVGGLGPDVHIVRSDTLERQVDESLLQERLISTFATAFGLLALVLSAVGLYGVLAYSVARRTSEIGIRMSLGARPAQVAGSILRQTTVLVAIGIAAGIPASMALASMVASLLFGVTPTDILTQGGAAILLATVAFGASYLPARRAGRIDPLAALRCE